MLTEQQKAQYAKDGYLMLPDLVTQPEREALIARAYEIIEEDNLEQAARFSTIDRAQINNAYFLGSAETIRCFFEEEAFSPEGELLQPRAQSINKIGHALHDLDPVFKRFAQRPEFGDIARDLGLSQPSLYQTMVIFKQPRIGGEVTWHQDATFFYTEPSSVITYWFALEDATLQNGCLWLEPGGHQGPLRERYLCEQGDLSMRPLSDQPWPTASGTPMPVKAGSLLVFHGHLPHYSAPNRSDKSRIALTFHVVDGACEYAPENWLQRGRLGSFSL
ncbi:phytanoyl-CoA dioxygenase family protein [Hahella aquimaris]|uniref:phytanoyl-CoA dioxygenase family protein n=1 Tax=Hahella sp. HNIBRBA332 TaxID=3015983 RepID=UPI00273C691E|nr:phytanoyl-CoA dioxygenase family protein [Hahella sp. HNIBRBA332]WLQ16530.1 phytanoyl-CoA dioxygenase family protein [Hahella sp. HNIBRBA332]